MLMTIAKMDHNGHQQQYSDAVLGHSAYNIRGGLGGYGGLQNTQNQYIASSNFLTFGQGDGRDNKQNSVESGKTVQEAHKEGRAHLNATAWTLKIFWRLR